jgi:hypothetical protein
MHDTVYFLTISPFCVLTQIFKQSLEEKVTLIFRESLDRLAINLGYPYKFLAYVLISIGLITGGYDLLNMYIMSHLKYS